MGSFCAGQRKQYNDQSFIKDDEINKLVIKDALQYTEDQLRDKNYGNYPSRDNAFYQPDQVQDINLVQSIHNIPQKTYNSKQNTDYYTFKGQDTVQKNNQNAQQKQK